MRASRFFHIGQRGAGRRKKQEIVVLRPIADNNAWSLSGSLYTNVNDGYNFPELSDDITVCTAKKTTDDSIDSRWYFGGLNNGPQEFYRIDVLIRGVKNGSDGSINNFVIGGATSVLTGIPALDSWSSTTIYGKYFMKDFIGQATTSAPYISITPNSGNNKDMTIRCMQIRLYGN